ncbi:unnamed protein product [marine sediment metagenome]|uniref:Nudix hydrolase domain-containing protein n=1 Tax=marine sediment metagenome TaxID=412755 RepID=X1Q310_9ZZZZ
MNKGHSNTEEQIITVFQRSAGGIVFRTGLDVPEVVLIKTAEEGRWQIPKGLIDPGETLEQAALREVREETGLDCKIVAPVESIEYWFYGNYDGTRKRYHKRVDFFLMQPTGGDTSRHDSEVVEVRWVSINEAVKMLSFENERQVMNKAASQIEIFSKA